MNPPISPTPPSLSTLSNELLLDIADCLAQDQNVNPSCPPLKNLSLVNHHFRTLFRPLLLRSIVLATQWDPSLPGSTWSKMHHALLHLTSPPLPSHIKSLHLDLTLLHDEENLPDPTPLRETANFLPHLTSLSRLHLQIPEPWNPIFESTLETASPNLTLPLATLLIEQPSIYLLRYCPLTTRLALLNTRQSSTLNRINLPTYAAHAPHVTHLEAHAYWSESEVACLGQAWPGLTHLGAFPAWSGADCPDVVDLGEHFPQLKVLALAVLDRESFWAGGNVRVEGLFRGREKVRVEWGGGGEGEQAGETREMGFGEFMGEWAGRKIVREAVEYVFLGLRGLEEVWFGDVVGARQVGVGEECDCEEEFVGGGEGGEEGGRVEWTLRFEWLGDYFHGGGQRKRECDWLLRPR